MVKRRCMHAQSCACDAACLPTRTRVYVEMRMYGCRTSNTDGARPPRCAPPAGSGTYIAQRGDGGGVPRADVRVERRVVERLRAEPHSGRCRWKGLARFCVDTDAPKYKDTQVVKIYLIYLESL